jgi:hypothetical protein
MAGKTIQALVGGIVVLACSAALGQEWARKMFQTTHHDFGTVAAGAKTQYEFVLRNPYVEDIHIASVRTSCGCTTPSIKKEWLKTYEEGAIVAVFNTRTFSGSRGATLTVTIDKPFYAQVQLQVSGYIRRDVVLDPGMVDLGTVDQGAAVEKSISVNYAGRADWRIVRVKSTNPHLSASLQETGRDGGQISYKLTVRMDEQAPAGPISDHLVLVTNDRSASQVPVPVQGMVQSGIVVAPATLFLGILQPGQKVTKQLVIKGKKPFRILSVAADGDGFQFDTSREREAKQVHVIPVTFVAGTEPGKINKTIRIETDLGVSVPALPAHAEVAAK